MNIWTSENIMKYWDGTKPNAKGEWTIRNGENAIAIQPNNFHENGAYIQIFKQEFLPNTQYIINLQIDSDDVVHNEKNVAGGMSIHYTDGSVVYLNPVGDKSNPKGWQQKLLISDPSKSIDYMSSYYYTSIPVYYRWDSFIIPLHSANIEANGTFITTQINNNFNLNDTASIQKGGIVYSNTFYEF